MLLLYTQCCVVSTAVWVAASVFACRDTAGGKLTDDRQNRQLDTNLHEQVAMATKPIGVCNT